MVDLSRLELPTSRLSGVRSNHLSYRSMCLETIPLSYSNELEFKLAGETGFEPATSGFGDRRSAS